MSKLHYIVLIAFVIALICALIYDEERLCRVEKQVSMIMKELHPNGAWTTSDGGRP